jgi:glycerophosphoryl diester phosphodiesterase
MGRGSRFAGMALGGLLAACSGSDGGGDGAGLVPAPGPAPTQVCMDTLSDNPWLQRRPLNIAHAGGNLEFPDNTLFAYEKALQVGAHMLEMDIWQTADGELVVIHDGTVDRTTNGSGAVPEMTLAELKALDAAHNWVPDRGIDHNASDAEAVYRGVAAGTRPPPSGFTPNDFTIPTVREVLERFPNTLMNIELKQDRDNTGEFEANLAALLNEYGRGEDVVVASFADDIMFRYKRASRCSASSLPLGQVALFVIGGLGPLPGIALGSHQAFQVPINYEGIPIVTPDFVDDAHRRGIAVQVWTIDDCPTMESLLAQGVDGIMTNRPSTLNYLLREGHCPGASPAN